MSNPWGLTVHQEAAMDAYVATGSEKGAAYTIGSSFKTISTHVCRAKRRMKAATRLHAALMWDRWRRAGAPMPAGDEFMKWRPV